jgi:mono/diheme cytochrome c family protein
MRLTLLVLALVYVWLAYAATSSASQNTSLLIPSLAGQDLFAFYCASCHGSDAKGNGPMATVLKTPPPDLTRLALRNSGNFPRERVVQFVGGGGSNLRGSHGSNEMPVWGPIFKALDPNDERLVLVRLDNIVRYLESIQVK